MDARWLGVLILDIGSISTGYAQEDPREIERELSRQREYYKSLEKPIVFYGKVIDQDGRPVSSAEIVISLGHYSPISGIASRPLKANSDDKGMFVFKDVNGFSVFIRTVDKDGYEFDRLKNKAGYDYSVGQPLPSDPANPALFHMRKKGPPNLVIPRDYTVHYLEYGKSCFLDVVVGQIWNQDTPKHELQRYDRATNKDVPTVDADLRFEWSKSADGKLARLVLRASREGDGVQKAKTSSNLAPADGYGPEAAIELPVVDEDSEVRNDRYVFARIRGKNYVRLDLSLTAMPEKVRFRVKTWYNPNAIPNLEYDDETFRSYQRNLRRARHESDQKRLEEIQKMEKENNK